MKWAPAVIMVGVLFAAYHILLLTIPSIIILGVMITFVVYRTRSIWAGVLYHFIHNFLSVCLAYAQPKLMDYMEGSGMTADMPQLEGAALMLSGIIAWGVIGAFCLALFGVFTWLLHYRTRDIVRPAAAHRENPPSSSGCRCSLPGALILCLWVVQIHPDGEWADGYPHRRRGKSKGTLSAATGSMEYLKRLQPLWAYRNRGSQGRACPRVPVGEGNGTGQGAGGSVPH